MRAAFAGLLAALSLAGSAVADPVSERPDSVAVTTYRDAGDWDDDNYWEDWEDGPDEHDGLVLVTEVRTIEVPAGRSKISFRGVADGIIPQTAAVEGLPGVMLERNQDYDLLNPGALIAKSIGSTVRLVRTNKISGEVTEETAIVRSGPQGVVLDFGDGRIEAVGCGGWPERLIFDELPQGLADKPTLSVVTNAAQAGRHQVRLSYLAFGLKWAADYVAQIHPDGKQLDLSGWITLANRSDTSFFNAPTQVVAGEVARDDQTRAPSIPRVWRTPSCWQMGTTTRGPGSPVPPPPPAFAPTDGEGFVEAIIVTAQRREESIQDAPIAISAFEGELADYKLYTLPEPTTVAAHQTKQVMLLQKKDVPFERLYVRQLADDYDDDDEQAAVITLRLQNRKEQGLGRALPGGRIAVMAPYDGGLLLAGEHRFRDAPVGQPLDITLGRAIDVRVVDTELRNIKTSDGVRRDHEVRLSNGKDEPVTVELRLRVGENLKLVSASQKHGRRYADLTWTFRLKPGETQTMRYVTEGY